jgi:TM2 domain-containing membrane protein YozV
MEKNNTELIITILFGWFGFHKFIDGELKLGTIYFFTFGLFGIGWFYDIYSCFYYNSESFNKIKESIKENTDKCNELNEHIEELKNSYIDVKHIDYGIANYIDNSKWNYKRPAMQKYEEASNLYNCSRTVCSNARNQPFKYICKYFNIKETEENLEKFEKILNDFSAAEQGKDLLKNERNHIINNISNKIPFLIMTFDKKRLIRKLGFNNIDFSQLYFPRYTFKYISPGGNSSMQCTIELNIENLNGFINYLSSKIKFRKSAAGQRALMTTALREKIKMRDNYTCCSCGNSIAKEPNLLLEIDHIIPISKNGLTTEENLQTLCWKCNRSKGAKIIQVKENK